jgi:hypothetical protein
MVGGFDKLLLVMIQFSPVRVLVVEHILMMWRRGGGRFCSGYDSSPLVLGGLQSHCSGTCSHHTEMIQTLSFRGLTQYKPSVDFHFMCVSSRFLIASQVCTEFRPALPCGALYNFCREGGRVSSLSKVGPRSLSV